MRLHWLFLISALGLAACQPREPSAPQGPKTAEAPPAATAALPPPSVQPPPAVAACPPQPQVTCPPPVRAAAGSGRQARAVRARDDRRAVRVQRAARERRAVDIPPEGGYRYDDPEDLEIERRYRERRYEAEPWADERYQHGPPPSEHAWRERDDDEDDRRGSYRYREDHRGHGYGEERRDGAWRDREGYAYERREDRYSGGPPRERRYEPHRYDHDGPGHAHDGYARRRSGHVTDVIREERGGVRRYEERSYEAGARSSERYSERRTAAAGGCCIVGHIPPAAGRDANGFLTWPGKVPAIP